MNRKILAPRIALNTMETEKFKSDFLSVSFVVPFDEKTAAENALALKILKRGTVSYPDMRALSKRLDALYSADIFTRGTLFGEAQVLSFSLDLLNRTYTFENDDILREALEVLREIIFFPVLENGVFKSAYFESEKQNLIDDIEAEINHKGKYAFTRLCAHMFADERYRGTSIGDVQAAKKLTNAQVYKQYRKILSTAAIEVTFVGHHDPEDLEKHVRTLLADCPDCQSELPKTDVIRTPHAVREIRESCVGKQGNLAMGFRSGTVLADGDYPKMALVSELFGGCPASMLFMNVREKKSLCYTCSSFPEATKGVMFVIAGIENDKYAETRDAILEQLERLKAGKFTKAELEAAKLSLINAYREIEDSPQALQNWHLGRMLSGIQQSPEEVTEIIRNLTKKDVTDTAAKIALDTVYFLAGEEDGGEN